MGSQFGLKKFYLRQSPASQEQFNKEDLIFDKEVFMWPTCAASFEDPQITIFISQIKNAQIENQKL